MMEWEFKLVEVVKGGKVWSEEEGFSSPSQLFHFTGKGGVMLFSRAPLLHYLFVDSPLVCGAKFLLRRYPGEPVGVWVMEGEGEWTEYYEVLLDVIINFARMEVNFVLLPLRGVLAAQRAVDVLEEERVEPPVFGFFYPENREGYSVSLLNPALLRVPFFHVFSSPRQIKGWEGGWGPFGAFVREGEAERKLPLRIITPAGRVNHVAS